MNIFSRLVGFSQYGTLNEAYIKAYNANHKKKQELRRKRAKARAEAVATAEKQLGMVDRYVFGITGDDVVRNQDRALRDAMREMRDDFRAEYDDEIHEQMRYIARQQKWWKYSDDLDLAIYRKAEREVWRDHSDEYPLEEYFDV